MSPTKMLGTNGTKALAPSRVQRLSARTSSGTPLHWGQVATSLLHVLPVKSHLTPEYAWEGVERALSSTNAVEHLSLPHDPASRRLFGVPIVATVSEAAGVAHVLATDAVLVDTDSQGVSRQPADGGCKPRLMLRWAGGLSRDLRQPTGPNGHWAPQNGPLRRARNQDLPFPGVMG